MIELIAIGVFLKVVELTTSWDGMITLPSFQCESPRKKLAKNRLPPKKNF